MFLGKLLFSGYDLTHKRDHNTVNGSNIINIFHKQSSCHIQYIMLFPDDFNFMQHENCSVKQYYYYYNIVLVTIH